MDSALLASGGLDSTTLAYWLKAKGISYTPIIINYGQHFFEAEYDTLKEVLPPENVNFIKVVDVSTLYEGNKSLLIREPDLWNEKVSYKDMHLPYRNILLLTIGVIFASTKGYRKLYAGFMDGDYVRELDSSTAFFNLWHSMLDLIESNVMLEMPFLKMTKFEIAKLGLSLKAPIGKTFSCQVSSKTPCGACPNCVDRLQAIKKLGE